MKGFIIGVLLLIVALAADVPPQQPVIGIYTQDAETFLQLKNQGTDMTYIAASYVKNLQMAGAQVIPLFYHYSQDQLLDILSKINGVFFPGGQMPIARGNIWTDNAAFIAQYALDRNEEGIPYPVWATCLGYEALMYLSGGDDDNTTVFTEVFGQDGKTCPQIVKNNDSALLQTLNQGEYKDATTGQGIFFYHHRWAVLLSTFQDNMYWKQLWNLVSTSKTADGTEFVATVEGKGFPFFLTQYHPQKNNFEWRVPALRSYNAISATQKYINKFIQIARTNPNVYPQEQLKTKLIYNYKVVLTPLDYAFLQVYIFDESSV